MINNSRIFYSILAGFLFIFFIISNIEFFKRKISTRSSFILFIIIVAVIIGLRGEDIGADTKGYSHNSKILEELTKKKSLSFYYFEIFVKQFFSNVLIIYSFISHLFIYLIINSGRFKNYLVALFFFMVCVAYNGYLINVVRQGIGILGCLYFLESNHNKYLKLIAYLFFVLFHQTVILLLLSNYISKFVFERNLFFSFLLINFIFLFFRIEIIDLVYKIEILDAKTINFVINEFDLSVGLNWRFILFNLLIILFWSICNYYEYHKPSQKLIQFIFLTTVFILYMEIPYSDRVGSISWVLIPYFLEDLRHSESFLIRMVYLQAIYLFLFINIFFFYNLF